MRCPLFVLTVTVCSLSSVAGGEEGVREKAPAEALPPIFAPRPPKPESTGERGRRPPDAPVVRRVLSPEMSAKIAEVAKRAAPPGSSTAPASGGPSRDSSDVVKLAPFKVREDRLPEFKEREMLTPKGKMELARRRYPGLGPLLNGGVALQMLEDDFARERRQEAADLSRLWELGGAKLPSDVKQKVDDATRRPSLQSPQIGEPFRTPR